MAGFVGFVHWYMYSGIDWYRGAEEGETSLKLQQNQVGVAKMPLLYHVPLYEALDNP